MNIHNNITLYEDLFIPAQISVVLINIIKCFDCKSSVVLNVRMCLVAHQ